MKNRITLKSDRASGLTRSGIVGLTPEAMEVVQRIQLKSGLSARQIVSGIIVQAEPLTDIEFPEGSEHDE